MKKMISALTLSACLVIAVSSCKKSQDVMPQTDAVTAQATKEEVLVSEDGTATASRVTSGDNVTLILRPAKIDGQDAMILRYDPDPNYVNLNRGQEVDIPALTWTAGGTPTYRRSLINFTQLSFIPANATIVSATLTLYGLPAGGSPNCPQGNSAGSGFSPNDSYLRFCLSPWNENTVTWTTQPTTTNTGQVLINPTSNQWNENKVINIKPFVQSWVNGTSNYGMMLLLKTESPYTSITFGASENATNFRPKLVVVYHI